MIQANEALMPADKRMRVIRVEPEIHEMLGTLVENIGETYGDVVARVTKHYKSCPEVVNKRQQRK